MSDEGILNSKPARAVAPIVDGIHAVKLALQPQSPDFLRLGGYHGQCSGRSLLCFSNKNNGL